MFHFARASLTLSLMKKIGGGNVSFSCLCSETPICSDNVLHIQVVQNSLPLAHSGAHTQSSGGLGLKKRRTGKANRNQTFLFAASCSHGVSQVTSHLLLCSPPTQGTPCRFVVDRAALQGAPLSGCCLFMFSPASVFSLPLLSPCCLSRRV